jgi:3,4-dihydroxy-2-butanone 4-phosphate synthase
MPLSREFLGELTGIIKTWIVKEKLDWEKIKDYELKVMSREVSNGGTIKYCMLCDTTNNITVTGMWTDNEARMNTVYFICEDCAKEFEGMSEDQRVSIIEKIIEKRIDSTPVVRLSTWEMRK